MDRIRREITRRRKASKSPIAGVVPPRGSFVLEANWERAEELRMDRLGPTEEDVKMPDDSERPAATLD